jgi:hypothetical protein
MHELARTPLFTFTYVALRAKLDTTRSALMGGGVNVLILGYLVWDLKHIDEVYFAYPTGSAIGADSFIDYTCCKLYCFSLTNLTFWQLII